MSKFGELHMEEKLKHLEMIQGIIQRMANNSFFLKGWAITLVVAIFALSDQTLKQEYFLLVYLPAITFWFLDSYYLQLERKYKILYDEVREKNDEIDFDLNIEDINYRKLNLKKLCFIRCLFSKSEFLFYIPMVAILTVIFWRQLVSFLGL